MLYYFVGRYGKCQAVYRSASTGFFFAALFAGYNPKITPTRSEIAAIAPSINCRLLFTLSIASITVDWLTISKASSSCIFKCFYFINQKVLSAYNLTSSSPLTHLMY